ncbi:MAG TPA: XRE family transcriptional regulator [Devosia sp.]|nr:XRE family transcriptional regulator [Devosia sp.]
MTMESPQIGARVRRLRRQRHVAQGELAAAIGISASYLNLIEHNRRTVTVPLLLKLAGYFGIEAGELAQSDDSRLAGDLMEVFGDDMFADLDLTNQDIRDLARTNPVAARATLHLFDKFRELRGEEAHQQPRNVTGRVYHGATDAISDFVQENANHFPALEDAAERVRQDIDAASDSFETGLRTYLRNVFGMDWRLASLPDGIARRLSRDGRTIEISDTLPPETVQFSLCHHLGLMAARSETEQIIAHSTLPGNDAPALARNVLASYFAAALIMPYAPFLKAVQINRYDVERTARQFGASFEQVCHRMTSLQRPGASGIPLHLVRTDIAGNISKRFSLSGIHIPRHSGACPRWNVYSAFLQPGQINIQLSRMPDGETYFCIARSYAKGSFRHHAQLRHLSVGLGCHISHASKLIYSDGIDLKNEARVVPIGVGCRICPRQSCEQRAHPPADHRFNLSDAERGESLYARI